MKVCPGKTEFLCGERFVPGAVFDGPVDQVDLELANEVLEFFRVLRVAVVMNEHLHVFGKIHAPDARLICADHRTLNYVLEFPYVSRPVVIQSVSIALGRISSMGLSYSFE